MAWGQWLLTAVLVDPSPFLLSLPRSLREWLCPAVPCPKPGLPSCCPHRAFHDDLDLLHLHLNSFHFHSLISNGTTYGFCSSPAPGPSLQPHAFPLVFLSPFCPPGPSLAASSSRRASCICPVSERPGALCLRTITFCPIVYFEGQALSGLSRYCPVLGPQ